MANRVTFTCCAQNVFLWRRGRVGSRPQRCGTWRRKQRTTGPPSSDARRGQAKSSGSCTKAKTSILGRRACRISRNTTTRSADRISRSACKASAEERPTRTKSRRSFGHTTYCGKLKAKVNHVEVFLSYLRKRRRKWRDQKKTDTGSLLHSEVPFSSDFQEKISVKKKCGLYSLIFKVTTFPSSK